MGAPRLVILNVATMPLNCFNASQHRSTNPAAVARSTASLTAPSCSSHSPKAASSADSHPVRSTSPPPPLLELSTISWLNCTIISFCTAACRDAISWAMAASFSTVASIPHGLLLFSLPSSPCFHPSATQLQNLEITCSASLKNLSPS